LHLGALRELFREAPGSGVAPGRRDCSPQHILADGLEIDTGGASSSPGALYRHEYARIVLREVVLLLRREFDHPPAFGGIAEGGEDLPAHPKIRMVHVSALGCFGKSQG